MTRSTAAFALLAAIVLVSQTVSGQGSCPISADRANLLDFTSVKSGCENLDAAASRDVCDTCICSLVETFVPALEEAGFDLAAAGGFTAAEDILRTCLSVLFVPLSRAEVPLTSLLNLGNCGYTAEVFPECVTPFLTPSTGGNEDGECNCSEEFDPVCDFDGNWFTNLCISKCEGAQVVERCTPVFKEVEEKEDPFVLTENDGPLIWKPGCACSRKKRDSNPVCDIDGKQYASECYATCQGVENVYECESLVIDFLPSGEGPLVEALDGDEPSEDKPDVNDQPQTPTGVPSPTPTPSPPAPSPTPPTSEPPPTPVSEPEPTPKPKPTPKPAPTPEDPKEEVIVPPEVLALFSQFGVDVSALPPELTLLAYKVVNNEAVTDEELARAREIMQDEEIMAEVRKNVDPVYVQQIGIFAQSATGNNKILLQELSEALAEPPPPPPTDAFTRCVQSCKPSKMVCSQSTGIKFESGCHARCAGVTDIVDCEKPPSSPPPKSAGSMASFSMLAPVASALLCGILLCGRLW
ncbi:hypothetical protein BSKO_02019 [Bryopsis sp. KO-2023]|nr:hypothetical protein BSKO_02019 [Bryopsis sp. KO-2023]